MTNFKHHFIYKLFGLCVLTLIIFISKTHVDNVKADIAPPEPPSGTTLMPMGESTNVRMVSETVLIEIDEASVASNGFAKVEAIFTMHNLGDEEEQMEVRFPLDQRFWPGSAIKCNEDNPFLIGITGLKAFVNGKAVRTEQTNETFFVWAEEEPLPISLPCWAEFPVIFPVGEDVIIKVAYSAEPYRHALAQYEYSYVLVTGEGWKGTIGSADIIFQTPYELHETNFISCQPHCEMGINEVRWHYEDFELDFNVKVSLLPPPVWQKILDERENIARNSKDGNAWGCLAIAYKESIIQRRGFRSDEVGKELYQLSKNAYRKAVSLLPNDADLQYDYADLLCWNAECNNFFVDSEVEAWRECVAQYQQVYDLDP